MIDCIIFGTIGLILLIGLIYFLYEKSYQIGDIIEEKDVEFEIPIQLRIISIGKRRYQVQYVQVPKSYKPILGLIVSKEKLLLHSFYRKMKIKH